MPFLPLILFWLFASTRDENQAQQEYFYISKKEWYFGLFFILICTVIPLGYSAYHINKENKATIVSINQHNKQIKKDLDNDLIKFKQQLQKQNKQLEKQLNDSIKVIEKHFNS